MQILSDTTPAFALRGVEQVRGDVPTLRHIDLDIPAGEVVALVGPSGAGKTSLIRLLNRLDDPTAGNITYNGAPITGIPVRELRQRVGFVFQSPVMFTGTVTANLDVARDLARSAISHAAARAPHSVDDALRLAGVDPALATRDAQSLSGGER